MNDIWSYETTPAPPESEAKYYLWYERAPLWHKRVLRLPNITTMHEAMAFRDGLAAKPTRFRNVQLLERSIEMREVT